MTDSVTFNPYEAPQQTARYQGLAPDTEFLFSRECVLCGDTVTLPTVCISTGRTDELESRSETLTWVPRWLYVLRILLIIVCVPIGGALTRWFSPVLAGGTVVCGLILVWAISHRLTRRLQVTWYLDRRICRDEQRRHRFWTVAAVCCTTAFAACLLLGIYVQETFFLGVAASGLGALVAMSRTGQKTRPVFAGRHEGLNVLVKLSGDFLAEVHQITERQ